LDDDEEDVVDEDEESEEDVLELSDFFSACLASCLSAPDSAAEADCRLRLAVP
jgi:hypothetical protein